MPAKKVQTEEIKVTKAPSKTVKSEVKKPTEIKEADVPVVVKKSTPTSVALFSIDGKSAGNLDLPKEIFGTPVNESLLLQAIRIYSNNRQSQHSHTKTRGEVHGTTKKVYKQKGTGNARHGSKKAPIYVGGGIALGPRSRNNTLELPHKMRQLALISALSQRASDGKITAIDTDKASGKTKEIATLLKGMKDLNTKSVLFLDADNNTLFSRGVQNIAGSGFKSAFNINVFDVISYKNLILTKAAVDKLTERFSKKAEKSESETK